MAEKVTVREKCVRCRMRAHDDDSDMCDLCNSETAKTKGQMFFDHYFWGLDASRDDEEMYFIRIYQECDDLKWLIDKRIHIDLEKQERKVKGIVVSAECMQKPPYRSGDVVAVTLIEIVTAK